MMKRILMVVLILLLALSLPLSTAAASNQPFSDVSPKQHFAEAVNELAARNIIGGYPDGTFKPGNPITRGQAAAMIAKLTNLDMTNVKDPGFKDVSKENGYYKAIAALAEANIIGGYEDGRYGPNDPVKRGQFASILVKAFDLPRYNFYDIQNPFKDVVEYQSHGSNILVLYRLGISTGTSPDKFSINAPVTRGQAAKMMKATEDKKPAMVTLEAEDVGVDKLSSVIWRTDTDLYEAITAYGNPGYTETKIQLVPLKEGEGTLNVSGYLSSDKSSDEQEKSVEKKYYVHIKKVDSELKLTLEETDDYLPTEAPLEISADEKIQNISLSTADGKLVSDSVAFKKCSRNDNTCIKIDQPGVYIATARFTGNKEVRYAIEANLPERAYFNYDIKTLRERLSYTFDVEEIFIHDEYYDKKAVKNIGKHTILTKNAEEIATVTRDPGTNVFHVTAKKTGSVEIEFENPVEGRLGQIGDGLSGKTTGMKIEVQRIGGLINISPSKIFEFYPDM